jgi:hypothetical protein
MDLTEETGLDVNGIDMRRSARGSNDKGSYPLSGLVDVDHPTVTAVVEKVIEFIVPDTWLENTPIRNQG